MNIDERLNRYLGQSPHVDATAYIAPSAVVVGDVRIGPKASIWPMCVVRGDINSIRIGEATNVQDGTIIHLADEHGVLIGNHVTIGHGAIVHACTVEDECLIGMRATILDGAVVGHHSMIGACTLVTKDQVIPPGSLVMGSPGKVVRALSPEEQAKIRYWAEKYTKVADTHRRAHEQRGSPT
jgi:carbonic anhydrase/acetyltransferase-like protein (isoleucine patch superfamily)